MPQLDPEFFSPQLVWLAITFGLMYLLMAWVALPRVEQVLTARAERIADDLSAAEECNRQAEEALAAYEAALAEARARAHEIAAKNRDQVRRELEKHRADLDARLAASIAEAEARIRASTEAAMANVAEIAAPVAGAIVARLIGIEPDSQAIDRAVRVELPAAAGASGA